MEIALTSGYDSDWAAAGRLLREFAVVEKKSPGVQ
jgi:hypothetical protein